MSSLLMKLVASVVCTGLKSYIWVDFTLRVVRSEDTVLIIK